MQHHPAKYDLYRRKEKCRSDVVTELTALGRCHQLVKLHATHLNRTLVITRFKEDFILFAKAGLRVPSCLYPVGVRGELVIHGLAVPGLHNK
jgi:hypothetical protein